MSKAKAIEVIEELIPFVRMFSVADKAADLIRQQAAEIERLKEQLVAAQAESEKWKQAFIRDRQACADAIFRFDASQAELATARGLLRRVVNNLDLSLSRQPILDKALRGFLLKSPESPRPEPGTDGANDAATSVSPSAELGEDSAKLTDEFRKAADIEAVTPITVGASVTHHATCPPMTGEQMARLWADYSGGVPESWDALAAHIWPNVACPHRPDLWCALPMPAEGSGTL